VLISDALPLEGASHPRL